MRDNNRRDPIPDFDLDLATFQKPPAQAGLSLDDLSAAFARMLDQGASPYSAPQETNPLVSSGVLADRPAMGESTAAVSPAAADAITPRGILEAILFVGNPGNAPITADQLTALMRGVRHAEIDDLVSDLNAHYAANNCPYHIVNQEGGFRLLLRSGYEPLRDRYYARNRQARLSKPAIEVLSIVAYNQPIGAADIDKLRGKSSSALLRQLVRRELLSIRRANEESRAGVYQTTDRFLELFGLAHLDELPRLDDLQRR